MNIINIANMVSTIAVRFITLHAIIIAVQSIFLEVKPETLQKYKENCRNVTRNGVLRNSMLVGKTWRICYTWNMRMTDECVDIRFKYANNMMIDRMWKDMHGYLLAQPHWPSAVLLMVIGRSREILLFEDNSGVVGNFLGVPLVKSSLIKDLYNGGSEMPLLQLAIKVIQKGKYLLASDCHLGVTMLAVCSNKRLKQAEIEAVVAVMNFGDAFPSCVNEHKS